MGGFFGVASKHDCVTDLFYGTDYHSHLGTRRGGMAVQDIGHSKIGRYIHDISNAQFRSKFHDDLNDLKGNMGIGIISDYEDQPLIIGSHLGTYSIVTVGKINNVSELAEEAFKLNSTHFTEMGEGEINPTELVATLINQEETFENGIRNAQDKIDGSCSILIMTSKGIYAARDKRGITPVVIGKKEDSYSITMETSAFPNLGYSVEKYLGPGEVIFLTPEGIEDRCKACSKRQICAFMWVYYGYPSSCYEGINAEVVRNKNGALIAEADLDSDMEVDIVAGIPDSGKGHAIGYASRRGLPFSRPFVKYTPTWPRSFMPTNQKTRNLVANMKLIPVREVIDQKRILFCDDSIVRGTQLQDNVNILFECGAKEAHMRAACPPLVFGCKFLNFSRSRSILDLVARRAIKEIEGHEDKNIEEYINPDSDKYELMVKTICDSLIVSSLKYQRLDKLIEAIGLPESEVCTYCWTGREIK
jgi:amidophosphoribosyltransferase